LKLNLDTRTPAGAISVNGALDIYGVESMCQVLVRELAARPTLTLNLAGVTECDTAGVQVIIAARKSSDHCGKRFQFEQPSPIFVTCCQRLGVDHRCFTSEFDV
jgi:anti-anti-sigma regulatory factor